MVLPDFHPLIQRWFEARFDAPTDIQQLAWPSIAAGEHVLITAPTGSGKTLTAFLWSINRFVTGDLEPGTTRVLYVSPLKALNNDIQRNLIAPLNELKMIFEQEGQGFPDIRVQTRSGDTDSETRRKMLRHPPEILITTPESLNLLLSSLGGQGLLYGIETVILDEIHGVVESKRGVYLMSAVERLVPFSGEFQRIALSATVNPLAIVASLVAGFERVGNSFRKREVRVLNSNAHKRYQISIRYPEETADRDLFEKVWDSLAVDFHEKINANTSTLLFVNSRALCEKLTFKINTVAGKTLAYAHHGSLSRDIRSDVERRLKEGSLAAIVATSTLEMGIDIGALDEVILIQSPGSVSSSIQRIGRAGHGVGEVSKCTIYPTHPHDFIEAAVLAKAVMERDIEPINFIECPLDVLAQVIISMTGTRVWDRDELFIELHRSTPYQELSRQQFDLVINMLAGRYADSHIRELRPRIIVDRLENTIAARKGALMSLYLSGGVIPDRGYFQLRHAESNARIGELDEEFVWEANVGKVFAFGTQHWQVKKITHNDVLVSPGKASAHAPPFWKSESLSRNYHYAERINEFLEHANDAIATDGFDKELIEQHHTEPRVAKEIINFLQLQKQHCHADLPHRHHLLVEKIKSAPGKAAGHQIVLHTGWGAEVNRPLAMALEAGWYKQYGEQPEIYVSNESLVVQLPHDISAAELLCLAPRDKIETLLRARLEGSGFFGARFRENAGRALLLSKGRFNERKPLWMSRLQSQKLMDAVLKFEDFPILLETWRTCLKDEFDLTNLARMLGELDRNEIRITEVETNSPSPFARSVAWGQINTYMYMSDQPKSFRTSNLSTSLLNEVVFSPMLRPALPEQLITDFETRQRRLTPGYEPANPMEMLEWLKERSAIPLDEWQRITRSLDELHDFDDKIAITKLGCGLVVATEDQARIERILGASNSAETDGELTVFLANWLQHYGPVSETRLTAELGLGRARLLPALNELEESQELIKGPLIATEDALYWCDARNYEFLLRLLRQESRIPFEALPIEELTPFIYRWQTRPTTGDALDKLFGSVERLRIYPAAAELWETEILPARIMNYESRDLDLLFQEGDIQWIGTSERTITFGFKGDEELLLNLDAGLIEDQLLPASPGKYDFADLLDTTGAPAGDLAGRLWKAAWRGQLSNDTMAALRTGILNKFSITADRNNASPTRASRSGFNRWRGSVPFAGNWYRLHTHGTDEPDNIEREELNKDRVRLLLERYGILFRELLQKETEGFRWPTLYRSMRLMELSGEIRSGYFFEGIPGPQFISPHALRLLQQQTADNDIFWLNAVDPVSLCGLGLVSGLPRRIPSNHMVYDGQELVLVSERNGKSLTFNVSPDNEKIPRYLCVLRHLLYRSFQPLHKIEIVTINDTPVRTSPFLAVIEQAFNIVRDHKSIYIQREPGSVTYQYEGIQS